MSQTYKDLRVYQIALKLAGDIEVLVKTLPWSEKFRHTDQILRSSRSVVANIAEGFGRKKYKRDFIRFLRYALASCDETQAHLKLIFLGKLINKEEFLRLSRKYKDLAIRLVNYINSIRINDLNEIIGNQKSIGSQ